MATLTENQRPLPVHYRRCADREPSSPCICAIIALGSDEQPAAQLRRAGYRVEAPR